MSEHNNTFLSRIFGNSETQDDPENELLVLGDRDGQKPEFRRLESDQSESESNSESDSDSDDSNIVTHGNTESHVTGAMSPTDVFEDLDYEDEDINHVPSTLIAGRYTPLHSVLFEADESEIEPRPRQKPVKVASTVGNTNAQGTTSGANITQHTRGTTDDFSGKRKRLFPPKSHKNAAPLLPLFEENEQSQSERRRRQNLGVLTPHEKALWIWANVENLDLFLEDVYQYFLKNGFQCILIKSVTDTLTLLFTIYFSTYLTHCIDYSKLSGAKKLSEVQYDFCYANHVHWPVKFALFIVYTFVILKIVKFCLIDYKKLVEMRNFYRYLLQIDDNELQTISWQIIVKKLIILRDSNGAFASNRQNDLNSKKRMTAHDVANRIMRKENYLVALFNRDVLNFQLDYPLVSFFTSQKMILTRTMEWNLSLCILGFVFNNQGQFKPQFLKKGNRKRLSEQLRKRFLICGALNIVIAPFLASYFVLLNFFRVFYEYKSNPTLIGAREFSPYAEWKFREYNELHHFFKKRIRDSEESANEYLNQFPKERINLLMKFVAFVSGALATVLILLTLFDPDLSINFEITENKSVLFYIGLLGSVYAIAHGATSNSEKAFEPEQHLRNVAEYTHYWPSDWEGRYHSEDVKNEFAELFQMKLVLTIKEFLSILFVPFVFWFALPECSDDVIDFFREFTVHVDSLGYVCSFAMFDVEKKKPKKKVRRDAEVENDDNKMLKSYLYFVESYADGNGNTNPSGNGNGNGNANVNTDFGTATGASMYLSRHVPTKKMSNSVHNFVGDESYLINLKDEPKPVPEENGVGVLGMIDQFYKKV